MKPRSPAFNLREAYKNKMEESGLEPKDVRSLGLIPCTPDQAPKELTIREPGILIPYFDIQGRATKFWRYRYLKQPERKGFEKLVNGDRKPLRYLQPKNSVNQIYIPRLKDLDWREIAGDTDCALMITEGELKAACANVKTDIPTLGLGGVACWRAQKKGLFVLPEFEEFEWEDRLVYICYDSDAVSKPDVMREENRLAQELLDRGAIPYVVRLPSIYKDHKTGLDDFLVEKGAEAFDKVLDETTEWKASRELHALNEEVILIEDPGMVMRVDTMQLMSAHQFTDLNYAPRVYHQETLDAKGNAKIVEKSAAKEWLKWPQRATARKLTYAPGGERMIDGMLNTWTGWNVEPVKGDVSLWTRLLDFLFKDKWQERNWLERWLAFQVQNPGEKMYSSAVVWGLEQGTGKSFVGYSMFKLFGDNATEIHEEHLYASHNEWAKNKCFVMGEEVTSKDKRASNDHLKAMITQQLLWINAKYVPQYSIPDVINYYFTSNHADSFFLEDKDRRLFVHEVIGPPMDDAFYKEYEAWIGKPGVVGPGASALFYHLLHLDLKGMRATDRAPMTEAKEQMMEIGRSDLGSWVRQLKDDPDSVLRMDNVPAGRDLYRSEELLLFYNDGMNTRGGVTANGLARELTKQGFRKVYRGMALPTKTAGAVRLWAVRDVERYMAMKGPELAAHYDGEREYQEPSTRRKYK